MLCLTTDAAQQALLGTNWNDAIDVLDLGLDVLEGEEPADGGANGNPSPSPGPDPDPDRVRSLFDQDSPLGATRVEQLLDPDPDPDPNPSPNPNPNPNPDPDP